MPYGNMNNNVNNFTDLLYNYIGQTVTVFTTSGGASGCGFTGVLLSVNCDYIRLSNQQGTPPSNPLSTVICSNLGNNNNNTPGITAGAGAGVNVGGISAGAGAGISAGRGTGNHCGHKYPIYTVGSVCDIPINRIASFCHNAI